LRNEKLKEKKSSKKQQQIWKEVTGTLAPVQLILILLTVQTTHNLQQFLDITLISTISNAFFISKKKNTIIKK
jgi:hypothetical protein